MDSLGKTANPTCPNCGFRIFNRRFPKCESCGAELPSELVYSAAERATLWKKEELEARENAARRKTQTSHTGGDGALVSYWDGGYGGSDTGCASDGGCGGDGGGE